MFLDPQQNTMFSAVAATGASTVLECKFLKHLGFTVVGASTSVFTMLVRGTYAPTAPTDWTAAQSLTQPYDNLGFYDLETGNFVAGDTGVVFAANDVKNYKINVDPGLNFLCFMITSYTTGAITVYSYNVKEN